MKRVKHERKELDIDTDSKAWFQGPSYAIFRRCLHYPTENQSSEIENLGDHIVFSETKSSVEYPDGQDFPAHKIRWTLFEEMNEWAKEFPTVE
jgi:hypothetical protein